MKAVPHDAELCILVVLFRVPCFFEIFDAVKEVVAKKDVMIPSELVASLVVRMVIRFLTSKAFRSCSIQGEEGGGVTHPVEVNFGKGWVVWSKERWAVGVDRCQTGHGHRVDDGCCNG
jgi:hypothetical protein